MPATRTLLFEEKGSREVAAASKGEVRAEREHGPGSRMERAR